MLFFYHDIYAHIIYSCIDAINKKTPSTNSIEILQETVVVKSDLSPLK